MTSITCDVCGKKMMPLGQINCVYSHTKDQDALFVKAIAEDSLGAIHAMPRLKVDLCEVCTDEVKDIILCNLERAFEQIDGFIKEKKRPVWGVPIED